jgi:hypothetical protein
VYLQLRKYYCISPKVFELISSVTSVNFDAISMLTLCACVCVCVCVCAHAHGAEDWTRALCVLSKWSTTGLYPSPGLFLIDVYEWCALPFIPLSILRLSSYLCLVFCFIWVSSDTDFFYFKIVYFSIFAVFDILLYLQAIKIISVLLKVVKFFFLYPEF